MSSFRGDDDVPQPTVLGPRQAFPSTSAATGAGPEATGSFRITDARTPASAEHSTRVRRYTITMAFRTACFVAMIWVDGWPRWVLFAGAVFLPYIAVILANQAHQRHEDVTVTAPDPVPAPAISMGEHVEVIPGVVVEDGPVRQDKVA